MAEPDATTSARERRSARGPIRIAAVVPDVARDAFKRHGFAESELLTRWPLVIGERLAAHTAPERIRFPRGAREGGILTLRVDGALGLELQHLEPLVVERINTYCGYRAVQRLHLVQGPLPQRDRPARRTPRPLSPDETDRLATTLAGIRDGPLKQALGRLGASVLRRS